ncbi:hypothetical protein CRE_08749 [Caenorhabditis remanei]|uniref:Uncharacterized protein n=1 Tax=Caenorhabditis remanei TaxID=31234 RepID=E3LHB6_CAERE|nr:hypothetical protein CRE_08749 [Caenorhabditis remanei]
MNCHDSEYFQSPDQVEKDIPNCKVCGQPSHGIHFGAATCRACAAFFRRTALGPKFVLKCRSGNGKCKVTSNGRVCCKMCRLERCMKIGMDIKNFQLERDPLRCTQKITPSLAMFLGRPQFLIHCDPETASSSSKATFIDLSELLRHTTHILETGVKSKRQQNRLQKLSDAVDINRFTNNLEEDFKLVNHIGLNEAVSMFEHDLLAVTNWLIHFEEFQDLSLDVRLTFIKSFWHLWNRLEKVGRTAMFMKNRPESAWNEVPVLLADNCVLDVRKVKLDISWLSKYSVEQVGFYIEGVGDMSLFTPLQPILDLAPTEVELNYMLAEISFSHAAKQLGGRYSEIAENLLNLLADDLHRYYMEEKGLTRYSDRIAKMMKVNNTIMRVLFERKEKLEIAKTFDIFHVEYSEPEMFRYLS